MVRIRFDIMKHAVILVFVMLFLFVSTLVNAEQPLQPTQPKAPRPGELQSSPSEPEMDSSPGEIFFAACTTSPDGKYLYVVFDRFLLKYVLPTLEIAKKADLGIAVAPVTPSISISKDSKTILILSNGILYKVDAATFKITKQFKITP